MPLSMLCFHSRIFSVCVGETYCRKWLVTLKLKPFNEAEEYSLAYTDIVRKQRNWETVNWTRYTKYVTIIRKMKYRCEIRRIREKYNLYDLYDFHCERIQLQVIMVATHPFSWKNFHDFPPSWCKCGKKIITHPMCVLFYLYLRRFTFN